MKEREKEIERKRRVDQTNRETRRNGKEKKRRKILRKVLFTNIFQHRD